VNAAARELGLIAAAKSREPVLARARQIRAETGQAPDPRLNPPLILSLGDRVA
jgi:hypothetical protein